MKQKEKDKNSRGVFWGILAAALLACPGKGWGQDVGLASFYHDRFHGRRTASGVTHDQEALMAAHRTYPFGTFLRVTNLANRRSVVVCVTDRGPRSKSRLIDLSREAAERLDFVDEGVTMVYLEEVPGPEDPEHTLLTDPGLPFLDLDYWRREGLE